jgi:hypothetical protein
MGEINTPTPVLLMPFSPKSILLYHLLKNTGAVISCFCDNDKNLSSKHFNGTPIYSPSEAFEHAPKSVVVLSEKRYYEINEKQLREFGFTDIIVMDDLAFDDDVSKYVSQLNSEYYANLIPKQVPYGKRFQDILLEHKEWRNLLHTVHGATPYYFKNDEYNIFPTVQYTPGFLVCINATGYMESTYFTKCLKSIVAQKHYNTTLLLIVTAENKEIIERELNTIRHSNVVCLLSEFGMDNIATVNFARKHFSDYYENDLIITVGANDEITNNALIRFAGSAFVNKHATVYTANEDRIYADEYIAPFYKRDYQRLKLIDTASLLKNLVCIRSEFTGDIERISLDDIYVIDEVHYHYRVIPAVKYDNNIKPIAFYLPQFHTIPENDKWWGKGFTEWTNVKRAVPMYEGHYQPRKPGALGYYDLVKDKDIQKRQQNLARQYGIYGFCYYYYWFNGKRLLEKPLDNVLNNPELDMPFCICWANENWTRRWDGREQDILMEQTVNDDNDIRFIRDILPILKDPRYIQVNEAPILLIYRHDLFVDIKKTIIKWRKVAAQNGIPELHISIVKTVSLSQNNLSDLGCDSETEFPPWMIGFVNPTISTDLIELNLEFNGVVYDYRHYIRMAMNVRVEKELCFRGIMKGFDNTPRRMENASIFRGSNPEDYKKLLISLVDFVSRQSPNERLIFINAWNEWAEGNYLEPDEKYGDAYLRATSEAVGINC